MVKVRVRVMIKVRVRVRVRECVAREWNGVGCERV